MLPALGNSRGWVFLRRCISSRIRSQAGDLTSFCYYNWGQALLCLALFLLV